MTELIAYFGDPAVKEKFVTRARLHREQDRIVQGYGYYHNKEGWYDEPKGCAVGCTLEANDSNFFGSGGIHKQYEIQLGIPRILARLEDGIFESLPKERAMMWPEEFLAAIKPGADLSGVWNKFAPWLLVDPKYGVIQFAKTDAQRAAIQKVADLYSQEAPPSIADWREARRAAAADAAAYADAAYAYAAYAYADAAYAADAADAAADAAAYAAAYAAARVQKRQEWRVAQADKLLELLADAPLASLPAAR